ncbi:protein tyrosine phosphatase [Niveomyces insectorum RCEF 264]|uniref:Protein tyrosine phosphatase n=1 Tax=Niveomyces insectorum RCEF 264 TaxID=1081102 RepID=A0A167SJ90_9HYPO|nr:protein tyrosine phosphatase [Niveomyces insectorum RCEF 264]
MATIALTRPMPPHRSSSNIASLGPSLSLDVDALNNGQPGASAHSQQQQQQPQFQPLTSSSLSSSPPFPPSSSLSSASLSSQTSQPPPPVPNKHIPVCPPGPPVADSPSSSSPSSFDDETFDVVPQQSLLFPPDPYPCSEGGGLALYSIDAAGVSAALDYIARQPLPDPSLVFPWFHGLHPSNYMQQAFFSQRRRTLRRTPCCLRGLTVVKADGQLQTARLKGAVAPEEFLHLDPAPEFLDADPQKGFSVRNFQIQTAKTAMTSDIIVYGDDAAAVEMLGWDIAAAQQKWRDKHELEGHAVPTYNTFVCTSPFSVFEESYPHIVAVDADGRLTGHVVDFFHQERREMYAMTTASEISHNVWLGPTPEPQSVDEAAYDVLIECSDLGQLNPHALQALARTGIPTGQKVHLNFPSSGTILPPTWTQAEADAILETCKWIYHLAHGTIPSTSSTALTDDDDKDDDDDDDDDNDERMHDAADGESGDAGATSLGLDSLSRPSHLPPRKILIHCADGYTESTMLGIAYFSYSTGRPVPDAWLNLHTSMGRNFFAYPTDVALLTALAPRLLCESPVCPEKDLETITAAVQNEPKWFSALDGSFPSRILDYMYLGNLNHANNPELLKALGITQILSVGEMAMWRDGGLEEWGEDNVCAVQGVQDNGIDPLTDEFERCLDFIDRGRKKGTATLVHCRVGVSRSATICIAEVMRSLKLSFPRAYCFVRARRLNVIIQPHLRFAYELVKWEEMLRQSELDEYAETGGETAGVKRELEWGEIAREVALMNQPYVR